MLYLAPESLPAHADLVGGHKTCPHCGPVILMRSSSRFCGNQSLNAVAVAVLAGRGLGRDKTSGVPGAIE
jgi:hypothetical protein